MKHLWRKDAKTGWEYCRLCLVIRRADDKNKPCKGVVKLRPPEKPMADGVEAVGLSPKAKWILNKLRKDVVILDYRPLKAFKELSDAGYRLQMESERFGNFWTTYITWLNGSGAESGDAKS